MNALLVNIPSPEVRRVTSKDGKRQFTIQRCGLVGADGLAEAFEVWHDDKSTPYAPGLYEVDITRSVYVDRQGNLAIRPRLVPASKPKAA